MSLAPWIDTYFIDPPLTTASLWIFIFQWLQEVVHPLMVEMHQNPEHNKTHGLFWDLMPPPEELFTEEMFTPKQISMIQSELLEDRVAYAIQSVQEIYYGNYTSPNENARKLPPLEDVIGPGKVSLEQFRYFASLVSCLYSVKYLKRWRCNMFFNY